MTILTKEEQREKELEEYYIPEDIEGGYLGMFYCLKGKTILNVSEKMGYSAVDFTITTKCGDTLTFQDLNDGGPANIQYTRKND